MAHAGVALDVDDARGAARRVGLDALDPAVGAKLDSCGKGLRPVGHGHVVEGAARAAALAGTAIVAGEAAVVPLGQDGAWHGPPVPAQPVEAARHDLAHGAARAGPGLKRAARRHRRIARPAGNAACFVRHLEIRREVLVGNGPIRREAVLSPLAEIRWAVARPSGGVDAGGTADAVPHQRRLVRAVHRVVVRVRAHVDGDRPVGGTPPFPVPAEVRALVWRKPRALLQADHLDAFPGQHGGGNDAAGARADDDDVGVIVCGALGHGAGLRSDR